MSVQLRKNKTRQVKKAFIFILGILFGIGILLVGYKYLYGNKCVTLNQDYTLAEPFDETENIKLNCDTIFEFGEEMPKFREGDSELLKYNMEKIAPIIGESNKKTGNLISKINYSILISKEGKVLESEILSDVDEELKSSLENELNKMPNWIAGKVNGKNECMKIKVPISCIKWE